MKKVITYGTFDLLHYGHIRLLERAKALGDYLIVGVTSDDFDRARGKINVQQTLEERIAAVRQTGLVDKIILEEYEGQKIDDIKRYDVDIFAIGSDWKGKFDYLNNFCEVIYLDRTEGISSTDLRTSNRKMTMGIVGDLAEYLNKFQSEDKYVNGITITGICTNNLNEMNDEIRNLAYIDSNYDEFLNNVDSVYLYTGASKNYNYIKKALNKGKHVMCESPICTSSKKCLELFDLAKEKNLILMDAIRTNYSMAYNRLLLLLKSGKIGDILSIDVKCTSLLGSLSMNSLLSWGANALLPVFQILGTDYISKRMIVKYNDKKKKEDYFTRIEMLYKNAIANITVSKGVKTENDMIITGTQGYVYIPSPWWKTDYFEIRYENSQNNKRYFYQLDGEGIRNELVSFAKSIQYNKPIDAIEKNVSVAICQVIEDFLADKDVVEIN